MEEVKKPENEVEGDEPETRHPCTHWGPEEGGTRKVLVEGTGWVGDVGMGWVGDVGMGIPGPRISPRRRRLQKHSIRGSTRRISVRPVGPTI